MEVFSKQRTILWSHIVRPALIVGCEECGYDLQIHITGKKNSNEKSKMKSKVLLPFFL